MNEQDLHVIWNEMMQKTFDEFIAQNIGYDPTDEMKPKCYGSGDSEPWCERCSFQSGC